MRKVYLVSPHSVQPACKIRTRMREQCPSSLIWKSITEVVYPNKSPLAGWLIGLAAKPGSLTTTHAGDWFQRKHARQVEGMHEVGTASSSGKRRKNIPGFFLTGSPTHVQTLWLEADLTQRLGKLRRANVLQENRVILRVCALEW